MFVPASNRRYLDKALESAADALILDVEDSVPKEHKQEAREILVEYFAQGKFFGRQVFIRVNPLESDEFALDLETLAFDDLLGFVPSKIRRAEDVQAIDAEITDLEIRHGLQRGKFVLAPLIENASAIANVYAIAHSSSRLVALFFGGEDYLDSMHSVYSHLKTAFAFPRNMLAIAARSAGLIPVDTPYLDLNDFQGFLSEERESYQIGFGGCLLINPKQIDLANRVFSPTPEEIAHAEGVIAAIAEAKKHGAAVAIYNGVTVGPPMIKSAKKALKARDLIERFNAARTNNAKR